jgi:hypothetical protein
VHPFAVKKFFNPRKDGEDLVKGKKVALPGFSGHPGGKVQVLFHGEFGKDPGIIGGIADTGQHRSAGRGKIPVLNHFSGFDRVKPDDGLDQELFPAHSANRQTISPSAPVRIYCAGYGSDR